ncbi:dnaJ homolog subfamily C member 12 isoform X3 [Callithrix jacchus]|uniref:dnaJ homolog subfamily C member 12 isoform X3 n=1 Tax=Callithrix jacchus TaxID=9483 RepID=UPI00159DA769|nr:dnaJ homolog subfamily C member 12 isoform X3 [Callithrix jacchus]
MNCLRIKDWIPYYTLLSCSLSGLQFDAFFYLCLSQPGHFEEYWLNKSWQNLKSELWNVTQTSILKTPKLSMHWAVRGKKDLMLEESDKTLTNKIEYEEWNEQRERKKEELASTTEKVEENESKPLEKPVSPQNPDSSNVNGWHLRFRWSTDAPSELLRKFRNYEI